MIKRTRENERERERERERECEIKRMRENERERDRERERLNLSLDSIYCGNEFGCMNFDFFVQKINIFKIHLIILLNNKSKSFQQSHQT